MTLLTFQSTVVVIRTIRFNTKIFTFCPQSVRQQNISTYGMFLIKKYGIQLVNFK